MAGSFDPAIVDRDVVQLHDAVLAACRANGFEVQSIKVERASLKALNGNSVLALELDAVRKRT